MQITDYVNILRRRWWVIGLVALAAAVAAYAVSKLQEPLFRAEASYLVVPSRNDNGLLIVLRDKMNSYKSMALTPDQLEAISQRLELDRSADQLLKYVAVEPRPEEQLMMIQVDYPDQKVAQQLADAIGQNMAALVSSLNEGIDGTDKINMRLNQRARALGLYSPKTKINVLAGFLLGGILGLLLAFVLEALDDTLKSPADVERFIGLTTLGAIPSVAQHTPAMPGQRLRKLEGRQPL